MTPLVRNVVIGSVAGLAGVGILVAALRRPASQEETPPVTPVTPIAEKIETISLESDPFKLQDPVSSTVSVAKVFPPQEPNFLPSPPPPVEGKSYTWRTGDTFASVAKKEYGSAAKASLIREANPEASELMLTAGSVIILPKEKKVEIVTGKKPLGGERTFENEPLPPFGELPPKKPVKEEDPIGTSTTYKVKTYDTLGDISRKVYGTSKYAKLIQDANKVDPSALKVGQVLKIPAKPVEKVEGKSGTDKSENLPAGAKIHVVHNVEFLGDISKKYYGTALEWKRIADANGITDPRSLKIGQKLIIPAKPGSEKTGTRGAGVDTLTPPSTQKHTIVKGDTLGRIAAKYLGSSAKVAQLKAANPGLDDRNLKIGQVIVIPGKDGTVAPVDVVLPVAPVEPPFSLPPISSTRSVSPWEPVPPRTGGTTPGGVTTPPPVSGGTTTPAGGTRSPWE